MKPLLEIEKNYHGICNRIALAAQKSARSEPIVLIAVSKRQTVDAIESLYRLGHMDFGENYAQELLSKAHALKARGCLEIQWHFIGHLQKNKVKSLVPEIASVHSVDSPSLAIELSKRWKEQCSGRKLPVFIQVNVDQEESKHGILPQDLLNRLPEFSQAQGLSYQGLMCIPSVHGDPASSFARLRELEKRCRPLTQGKLSMGMSHDFEMAIHEGATHVRVGTALFGDRV